MIRRIFRYLRPPLAVLVGGFLMLALSVPSTAEERVIIQKSATNTQARAANNYIDQGSPNTVSPNALDVRSLLGGNRRALVLFDLSLLPNVGVKSAQLILTIQTRPLTNRTWGVYPLASFFTQPDVTWNTRVADLAWGAAGGDIPGTATATANLPPGRSSQMTWNVTADVQAWYSGDGTNPIPNFGELIKDQTEDSALPVQIVFDSNTGAAPPELSIQFVQNVANLSATAASSLVTLNWSYPATIGTVVHPTVGVLILRSAGVPVNKGSVPTDGTNYAVGATIGNGTVVFNNRASATTFTDSTAANGTMYYYKVFTQDSARNYSATGTSAQGGSVSVPEVAAMPSASAPYASNWILATYTTNLAPPSLFPGLVTMVGTQSDFLFAVNPNTGMRPYTPISLGGAISGRSPIVGASESSLGQDMVYAADQSGLSYGIAADTGQIVWAVDPLKSAGADPFLAAGALLVKSFATASYTQPDDILVLGTRNSTTTTGNAIVAVDANTGATVWTDRGGSNVTSMDMINSTPVVSYTNNAIWVATDSAGGTQPSLWELNANTGAVITTLNLGDIDSAPVLAEDESVLFVGNNAGTIYAINPSTGIVITSIPGGDGAIVGYPTVVGSPTGFSVYFSGATAVHALTYDRTAKTLTPNWSTPVTAPSAPIAVAGLSDVYVGSSDRTIHELNAITGTEIRDLSVDPGQAAIVGDPSLDTILMHIYVSVSDQRAYSFPFPL